jgi:hypothetical protein
MKLSEISSFLIIVSLLNSLLPGNVKLNSIYDALALLGFLEICLSCSTDRAFQIIRYLFEGGTRSYPPIRVTNLRIIDPTTN